MKNKDVTASADLYREIVAKIELMVMADGAGSFCIPALCEAFTISERTLRKAFHRVYGLPPYRCLKMLRLVQARHALLSRDRGLVTVTQIAMYFGFVELGRFSVEYRRMFGERPSQTLCRSHQSRGETLIRDTCAGAGSGGSESKDGSQETHLHQCADILARRLVTYSSLNVG